MRCEKTMRKQSECLAGQRSTENDYSKRFTVHAVCVDVQSSVAFFACQKSSQITIKNSNENIPHKTKFFEIASKPAGTYTYIPNTESAKEERGMSVRNTVKADVALKEFWKDNDRLADLFNAVLFDGEQRLCPEDLEEADVDLSSVLKFNGHVETLQRLRDVVKKTAYGMEFVIWGIENQQKIHYAMPLRHMIEDALSYLKEYNEIAKKNTEEKTTTTKDEFLSKFKKTDRLHPVITLCVYYGEKEWDGAVSLKEMLEMPDYMDNLVPDYKMNLIQVRNSEDVHFKNKDVQTIFELSRLIYQKEYGKITSIYKNQEITSELLRYWASSIARINGCRFSLYR